MSDSIDTCTWNVDTLRYYFEQRLDDLIRHLDERYEAQVKAVEKAFEGQQTAMQTAFTAADKAVDKALSAAEKAVEQRAATLDREFHEHLEQVRHENALAFLNSDKAIKSAFDASGRAIDKAESANEKRFESMNEFRGQLNDQAKTFMPRLESLSMHARTAERIEELRDRLNRSEGSSAGIRMSAGVLTATIGAVAAIVVVVNLVIAIATR